MNVYILKILKTSATFFSQWSQQNDVVKFFNEQEEILLSVILLFSSCRLRTPLMQCAM